MDNPYNSPADQGLQSALKIYTDKEEFWRLASLKTIVVCLFICFLAVVAWTEKVLSISQAQDIYIGSMAVTVIAFARDLYVSSKRARISREIWASGFKTEDSLGGEET